VRENVENVKGKSEGNWSASRKKETMEILVMKQYYV
jgi:hypothetical protein